MNKNKSVPKVAIVGRTNVGKSTLFNRLASKEKSMVFSSEGVTRDYIHEIISWQNKTFDLIDTGGLPTKGLQIEKDQNEILKHVTQNVYSVIEQADIILFVCDGKNGLTEHDRRFSKLLHKTKKPIFLLLNKSDNETAFSEHSYEFNSLGFKQIFQVSALHGKGIRELLESITEKLSTASVQLEQPNYGVVILGKPNVGKSSLLNLLLQTERAIVSTVAGTTREAISETITFHKEAVQITDTAGVRKKRKVENQLEQSMVKSSLFAVRHAEIVIVIIDSTKGHLSDQELKLLFYAYEQKKSIILLLNKTDILTDEQKERLKYDMKRYDFFIKKIPILWISCLTEKNIGLVLKEIKKSRSRQLQTFDQGKINELVKEALIQRPMYHKRQLLKVLNIKILENKTGISTFILYVNFPRWFGPTQLGFLENQLRKNYDLLGSPIKFILQKV